MAAVGALDGDTTWFEPALVELVLRLALLAADVHWFPGVGRTLPRNPCLVACPRAHERSAERVRVDAFVKVHGADGQELVFRTRDLSEHGVFLYTKVARAYPFKVGSTLALELYGYDEAVECKGVVVRVVEPGSTECATYPTGFGVRITECSDDARVRLRGLIAPHQGRRGLLNCIVRAVVGPLAGRQLVAVVVPPRAEPPGVLEHTRGTGRTSLSMIACDASLPSRSRS